MILSSACWLVLTLTAPCKCNDLSLAGYLVTGVKVPLWCRVALPSPISGCSPITPIIFAVVFMACASSTWWKGARTMEWPWIPCQELGGRVPPLELDKGLGVGRPWPTLDGLWHHSYGSMLLILQGCKLNSCWNCLGTDGQGHTCSKAAQSKSPPIFLALN